MVSWSVETLLLALYVIGIICAIYVAFKAFQHSVPWGVVFLAAPGAFYLLSGFVGFLIAGLVVIAAQFWYVRQPYNWKTWGRIYVYMVLCWAGATTIRARDAGWTFVPFSLGGEAESVQQMGDANPAAVEQYLPVDGGRIWYRQSGASEGTPVILLHGGPGAGSYALKSLEALGDERPVVRYDQLGAGRADAVRDSSLFTVAHFVAELDSLRSALAFERMHLVGHGWGGALALEYYRAHPEGVASLTLASPLISGRQRAANLRTLLATLSDVAQAGIRESEAVADFDSPDYLVAVSEFNDRYLSRRPDDANRDSVQRALSRGPRRHMWGPSEFTVTGTLLGYDASRQLRAVRAPTLFLVGEHEAGDTATVRGHANRTPGAGFALVPDAAHMLTWDNPQETVRLIREFLRSVDHPVQADSTP